MPGGASRLKLVPCNILNHSFQPRDGVPLAGMAAVLAEMQSGRGTKGLKKAEASSAADPGVSPPPAGSLLEELTEAMERRRRWLEDWEEEEMKGQKGGGGRQQLPPVLAVTGAGESSQGGGGDEWSDEDED